MRRRKAILTVGIGALLIGGSLSAALREPVNGRPASGGAAGQLAARNPVEAGREWMRGVWAWKKQTMARVVNGDADEPDTLPLSDSLGLLDSVLDPVASDRYPEKTR